MIECSAPVRYYVELRVPGPEGVAQLVKRLLHLHKAQLDSRDCTKQVMVYTPVVQHSRNEGRRDRSLRPPLVTQRSQGQSGLHDTQMNIMIYNVYNKTDNKTMTGTLQIT